MNQRILVSLIVSLFLFQAIVSATSIPFHPVVSHSQLQVASSLDVVFILIAPLFVCVDPCVLSFLAQKIKE
jgi:hypothetical protein